MPLLTMARNHLGCRRLLRNRTFEKQLPVLVVQQAAFSPDGKNVVVALGGIRAPLDQWPHRQIPAFSRSGRIEIYRVETGEKRRSLIPPTPTSYRYIDWSRDGQLIAASSEVGHVVLFDASSGKFLARLPVTGRPGSAYTVRFAHDSRSLYAVGAGNLLRSWSVPDGTERFVRNLSKGVVQFAISDDDRWFAAGGGLDVRLMKLNGSSTAEAVLKSDRQLVRNVAFIPRADVLVSCS